MRLLITVILFLTLVSIGVGQGGEPGHEGQGGQFGQQGQGHEQQGQQMQQQGHEQQGQQMQQQGHEQQGQQMQQQGQQQGQQAQQQQGQQMQQQGQQQGQQMQQQQEGPEQQGWNREQGEQQQQNQQQQGEQQQKQGEQQQQNFQSQGEQQQQIQQQQGQNQQQQQAQNQQQGWNNQAQQQQQGWNNEPQQQNQQQQNQQQQQQGWNNQPQQGWNNQQQQNEQQQQQNWGPEQQQQQNWGPEQQQQQQQQNQQQKQQSTPTAFPTGAPTTLFPTFVYNIDFGHTKETKVVPPDATEMDYFGFDVALHHHTAVIGAYGSRDQGDNSGAAYVYFTNASSFPGGKNGTTPWTLAQKLSVGVEVREKCDDKGRNCHYEQVNNARNSQFGYAVAIWNGTILVGAHRQEDRLAGGGSAYFFGKTGKNTWSQLQEISPSDGNAYHFFGYSVAMYENTAVLGATGDDHAGANSGACYVFRYFSNYNQWYQSGKLISSSATQYDNFGSAVAIFEQTIVIGAYGDSTEGNMAGAAYIYGATSGTWAEEVVLVAGDGQEHDYFGYAVAIYGDLVIVGAYQASGHWDTAGAAYVFYKRGDGLWLQQAKLIARDGMANDFFGHSVALYQDTAAIGAFGEQGKEPWQQGREGQWGPEGQDGPEGREGQGPEGEGPRKSRYLRRHLQGEPGREGPEGQDGPESREGQWGPEEQGMDANMQQHEFENCGPHSPPDCQQQNSYSYRGTHAGSVYIFARSGNTWLQEYKLLPRRSKAYDAFGCSVALYEDVLLVGADMADSSFMQNTGAAFFYAPPSMSPIESFRIKKASGSYAPITGEVELDAILATCLILVPAAMASVWWYLRFRKNNTPPDDRQMLPQDSTHSDAASFVPWSAHGVIDDSSRGAAPVGKGNSEGGDSSGGKISSSGKRASKSRPSAVTSGL